MSGAREFLRKWVSQNIKANTAAVHDDTLTAGRLMEECLWEAQRQELSADEVKAAADGDLLAFMTAELNRAAEKGNS